nr:ankyrin repeat protein [Pandoravirus massiliensis]
MHKRMAVTGDNKRGAPGKSDKRKRQRNGHFGCGQWDDGILTRDAIESCDILDGLPDEMVARILAHVPCLDLAARVRSVAQRYAAIVDDTAAMGRTSCVGSTRPTDTDRMIDRAAAAGHVACIRRAVNKGERPLARTFCAAAAGGHLAALKVLSKLPALAPPAPLVAAAGAPAWDEAACSAAASHGRIACLAFLHENGCPWDAWTLVGADCNGHLDCGDYARARGCPEEPLVEMRADDPSAGRNWIRCAHEHRLLGSDWRPPPDRPHGHDAPYIGTLFYAYQHGIWSEADICSEAARSGHLLFLIYAKACGMRWCADACTQAASRGRLDCLRYLHEQECPWDVHTMRLGVASRDDAVFAYLRDHGCPVDDSAVVCEASSLHARMPVLRDLCERMGCSVTDDAVAKSIGAGRPDVLAYLHQRGGRLKADHRRLAIQYGECVDCLRYVCENGHPPDADTLCLAVNADNFECVRYLCESGCPWHPDARFLSDARCDRRIAKYLRAYDPSKSARP